LVHGEITVMAEVALLAEQLVARVRAFSSCLVAYSGGVDSAVVAQAARFALGERAVAVTGTSASLATGELDAARELARQIGIRHEVIVTDELSRPGYTRNAPDRCFHCKTELYTRLTALAAEWGLAAVLNGTNADDQHDFRPGTTAAGAFQVHSPLAECGLGKDQVRALAAQWQLPVWNKPATPCLSSRIAYGQAVTPERLARVDAAERYLRGLGLATVRVRLHADELARIEAPLDALPALCAAGVREALVAHFAGLGFRFVSLDLEGFRSGSLNRGLAAGPLPVLGQEPP
jgi:uncharacterized protein